MNMTTLVEKENLARSARKAGRLDEAIGLLSEILRQEPEYEHGLCQYELSGIYEEIDDLASAITYAREALSFEPANPTYLEGLFCLLSRSGNLQEAFDTGIRLHSLESRERRQAVASAVVDLGRRIGLCEGDVREVLTRSK